MYRYIRILALCSLAGYLLATVFMTPGGAYAGAFKGFLVGALVAWSEWKWETQRGRQVRIERVGLR
jgi:membrane associated rhomboid family serine protease